MELKTLIARVCGDVQPHAVPDEARIGNPRGWDSLSHLALMVAVEERFGRSVGPSQFAELTSLEAIERWLQEGTAATRPSPPPNARQIADALRRSGLEPGDLAMVHSFTAALGIPDRPDRALIDALLDVLGPEGTLLLPAFTYSFCRTGVFDPENSSSEVGLAADTLLREYSGVRSNCPIFSAVAVGPLAEELAELRPSTTFGDDSIFGFMLQHGGRLCAVGVGFEKVTFNHYPEQELAVPYRYWKRFDGVVQRDGREEPVSVDYYVRSLDPGATQDFTAAHRLIAPMSFSGSATVGGAEIYCAPAVEYHRALRDAIERDPLFLLTPAARRHWESAEDAAAFIDRLREELARTPGDFDAARRLAGALHLRGEGAEAHRVLVETAARAREFATLTGACQQARRLLPASDAAESSRVSVRWVGSGTLDPVAEVCDVHSRARGIVPAVTIGDFGQFRADLLDAEADAEVTFVRVAPEALRPELAGWRYAGGDPGAAGGAAEELCELVGRWLDRSAGHAVVHLVAPWHYSAMGIADPELTDGARAVAQAFNDALTTASGRHLRMHLLDEAAAIMRAGARAHDSALQYHAGIELSGSAIEAVGREAARFVVATRRRPVKCIVTDLDNTLWGGIVGEDGVNGISLAGGYPGEAHRELQRWLLAHHKAGILLAICSKNERSDGIAPFEQRSDMLLSPDDFAAISIDWRPKPARVAEIAAELNIGVDSLLVIDDSAFERAAIRDALPEVSVPELPDDVSRWVEHLADLHVADALTLTEEDRRRASMYAEDRRRQDLATSASDMQAFLEGLDSVATFSFDEPAILGRTAQLCARTNQFNLNARRHSEGKIGRFIEDDDVRVIQMRAADRFGDLGVVGVAIVTAGDSQPELDTFLLSCRALGRGFEDALIAEAWRVASEEFGADALLAHWADNQRNAQVRAFLAKKGAKPRAGDDEGTAWLLEKPVPWPEHVRRDVL